MFESELKMSNREKSQATILIIEPDSNERNNLKNALRTIGFTNISDSLNFEKELILSGCSSNIL